MLPTVIYRTLLVPSLLIVSCTPVATAAQTPFRAHTMSTAPASPEWLQQQLTTLLASPYIHFSNPPLPGGRRLGHGPIDLFSTRFNAMFMRHARGLVGGREVDREGLKQSLLAMQKSWNAAQDHAYEDTALHHRIDGFHVRCLSRVIDAVWRGCGC